MKQPLPFALIRTIKHKAWSALEKSVGHTLRTSADDRQHLDPAGAVQVIHGTADWLLPWRKLVAGMWLPALKQGTQHTLAREFFLGASPEFFANKSQAEIRGWADRNVAWLLERFGPERVKLVALHLDEAVPHLAAYVVGLKADVNRKGQPQTRGNGWTLSDGILKLSGGKNELATLQTEYAAAMQDLQLRRGIPNSKATHQTTADWRKQLARPLDAPVVIPKVEPPTLADRLDVLAYGRRVSDRAAKAVFEQLKPYHQQAKAKAKEVEQLSAVVHRLRPLADAFTWLIRQLLGPAATLNTLDGLRRAQEALQRLLPMAASPPRNLEEPPRQVPLARPLLPPARPTKRPKFSP